MSIFNFNEHPVENEEYEEFKDFIKEYNRKKRLKQEESILYWIYTQFISASNKNKSKK